MTAAVAQLWYTLYAWSCIDRGGREREREKERERKRKREKKEREREGGGYLTAARTWHMLSGCFWMSVRLTCIPLAATPRSGWRHRTSQHSHPNTRVCPRPRQTLHFILRYFGLDPELLPAQSKPNYNGQHRENEVESQWLKVSLVPLMPCSVEGAGGGGGGTRSVC